MMINAQSFEKLLFSKKDIPTVIINGNIIANQEVSTSIPKAKIKSIAVKKAAENAINFSNLSEYGFILFTVENPEIEVKSQEEIRKFFGVDAKTKIYVDGFLVDNDDMKIASKAIKEVEIISPNERDLLAEKIINIWTLEKDSRLAGKNSGLIKINK
ncbi:hypothetical protein OA84_10325 [Kaistella solincola]|uniref:Uncharacterized protein n=2 Tax=Kaistella solincola TaxID=510955 RepID=A0ABR4ZN94_9FLAO|nr:hypothetical protein OA84_10325 [Kaistella solincola]